MQIILKPSDIERFLVKVEKIPFHSCWEWGAGKYKRGYGLFVLKRKNRPAHRISWIIHKGQIPNGLFVCHKCDNPGCVNPSHLFLGTQTDNMKDMHSKKRHRWSKATTCVNGHKRTEENTRIITKKNGNKFRSCSICRAESSRKYKAKMGAIIIHESSYPKTETIINS